MQQLRRRLSHIFLYNLLMNLLHFLSFFFAAQKIGHSKEGINAFYAGKRQEQQHSFAELCKFISQKYPRAEFRSEIIKNAQNGGLKQPLMQVISPHIHD